MGLVKFHNTKRLKSVFALLLFVLSSLSSGAYAAPYPATGSSLLVAADSGLFWLRQGFQLKTPSLDWQMGSPDSDDENEVRFLRASKPGASVSVRSETLKTELTLENYSKRWMKDYSNYGFDLLGTQTFIQSGTKALVVDLIHKKSQLQMRQVLFLKNKRVVILTCRDEQKSFEQTLSGCNQISKSFQWSDFNRQTTF